MAADRIYIVYILASGRYGTLYVGVTNDIFRRMHEHRTGKGSSFVRKYGVTRLVHMESFGYVTAAIQREKTLKHWPRAWKTNLIDRNNPHWLNLLDGFRKYDPKPVDFRATGGMDPRNPRPTPRASKPQDDTGE